MLRWLWGLHCPIQVLSEAAFLSLLSKTCESLRSFHLMWVDSEAAAWVSGAAETVDYFR